MNANEQDDNHKALNFSPLLIGLLGILAGAILVATYHCIAISCSHSRRRRSQNTTTSNSYTTTHNIQTVQMSSVTNQQDQPSMIQTSSSTNVMSNRSSSSMMRLLFPVFRYSKECNEGICAVCLNEFSEGERIRVLPYCFHLFHVSCIDPWLSLHSNCPLCRADTVRSSHIVLSLTDADADVVRLPPP